MVKIATWNVCLGLKNKKTYVSNTIEDNKIDICCIQECEIEKNYPLLRSSWTRKMSSGPMPHQEGSPLGGDDLFVAGAAGSGPCALPVTGSSG